MERYASLFELALPLTEALVLVITLHPGDFIHPCLGHAILCRREVVAEDVESVVAHVLDRSTQSSCDVILVEIHRVGLKLHADDEHAATSFLVLGVRGTCRRH